LEVNLPLYFRVASERGVQRFSFYRMGEVADVLEKYEDGGFCPMKGTHTLASEKSLARIDDPSTYKRRRRSSHG